jgi:hypothetical protein
LAAAFRLACLADVGVHTFGLHHTISKSRAGDAAMGVAVHHFRSLGAIDHWKKSTAAGFVICRICELADL